MTGTVLYNCKRCRVGKRIDYPIREPRGRHAGFWHFRSDDGVPERRIYAGASPDCLCLCCGKKMDWNFLRAFEVAEIPCDARCTGARGHNCECSCGGENHGKDWASMTAAAIRAEAGEEQ